MKQKQLKGTSSLKNRRKIIDFSMLNNLVWKQRHQFKLIALLITFILSSNLHAQTQIGSDIDGESFSDQFGRAISLNADGSIMAVGGEYNDGGAPDSGHVRIFQNINNNWLQIGSDINGVSASDLFGSSVALSADGNRVVIGALGVDIGTETNYGTATVYDNIGNNWVQVGSVLFGESQNNQFGSSVSISDDGNIIAIGASFGGASNGGYMRAYTFSTDWVQLGQDIEGMAFSDFFGSKVSLNADGTIVAVSASGTDANTIDNSGQVQVYQYNNSTSLWEQLGQNMDGDSIDDFFGQSLSLNSDGTRLIAGARSDIGGLNTGLAKIYEYNNGTNSWVLMQTINGEAVGDWFGTSASISADGNRTIVGARYNDGGNGVDSGHARVFEFNSGTNAWEQLGSDIDGEATNDESGYAVSINSDGTLVAIGARYNDAGDASSSANFGHARVFSFVNLAPIAVCQDITVQLDATGNATIVATDVDGGSSDPEGLALTFSVSQNTFDCSNLGANIVTLTVTDAGLIGGDELMDTCTATVTVVEEAPVANCTDVSIYLDENGMASITAEDVLHGKGKLYGLALYNEGINDIALYDYDANTPTTTVDPSFTGSSTLAGGPHLSIDINPVDETVYLLRQDYTGPETISNLYTITLQNGTLNPVLISSLESVSGDPFALSMSFGPDGTLYFAFESGEINAYNIATDTMSPFSSFLYDGTISLTTDLKNNRLIYLTSVYVSPRGGGGSFDLIFTEIDLNTGVKNVLTTGNILDACYVQAIEYLGKDTVVVGLNNCGDGNLSVDLISGSLTDLGPQATTLNNSIIDYLFIATPITNATFSVSNFTCADLGANTVTVSVTSICGTVVSCDATVTVLDTLPIIECPSDITVNVDPGMCDTVVNFNTPVSPNNCAGAVTVTQTAGMPSGSVFSAGSHTIEFTATDLNGIMTVCSFTIFVQDNIPPTITCSGDVAVNNDLGLCGAAVTLTPPTLIDNCGTAIAPSTGLVNFNFNIDGELIDTPGTLLNAITASSDVVLDLTFRGDLNGTTECFELNDPDGNILFSECDMEGTCDLINRQVTVPLATWNTWVTNFGSSLIFTLIANDYVDSGQCDEGEENPDTFIINALITGTIQLTNDYNQTADASGFYPVGDTVVTWTATDIGGNSVNCTQTITVNDAENPVITCPTNITVVNAANECDAVVTYNMPTATDNCTTFNTSLESILSNFNGNNSSVTALIPNAFDFILDDGLNSDNIDDGGNDMYDGGNYISTETGNDISYSDNLVVSDINFGTTGQYFTRKVEDMWLLVADLDAIDSFNIEGNLGADGDGTATGYTTTINVAGLNYNIFAKRVNEEVGVVDSDPSVNHLIIIPENVNATHNFTTDTGDDQHQVTALTGTTRLYYLLFASIDSGVVDDATMEAIATSFVSEIVEPKGQMTQIAGLPSGSTFPLGTTTNTFEATDEAGNTTTCSFDVIVSGTESPVINCPVDFEVNTDSDYTVLDYGYTVTDDCSSGSDLTIVQDPIAGTMVPTNNVITVSITATDAAGNETVCSFTITVSPTLGVSEFNQNLLQLFPNPASTTFTVKNLQLAGINTITIYDITGRVVIKSEVLTGSNNMIVDVTSLSNATYFVELKGEEIRVIKKLIVN
ncbi:HYR domain-containing protein [Xanthomarina sp. GH4-25]|uniref:HYR domain-containing protein n=1 Tax=Xanthomarina sp. GH4-25 TaxID=3349335 RepID=UPI003877F79B